MPKFRYYAIYKPFQTLSQFSEQADKKTLKHYFSVPKDVYPVGRLDFDSEGLLILTSDPSINQALLNPKNAHSRTYYVQVDGAITQEAVQQMVKGVTISINGQKHLAKAVSASILDQAPVLPERNPPIRFRKSIPAPWIALTLQEGKNRQVRRMCAAVGFPVLRLVRINIEALSIQGWGSGEIRELTREDINKYLHV